MTYPAQRHIPGGQKQAIGCLSTCIGQIIVSKRVVEENLQQMAWGKSTDWIAFGNLDSAVSKSRGGVPSCGLTVVSRFM